MTGTVELPWIGQALREIQAEMRTIRDEKALIRRELGGKASREELLNVLFVLGNRIATFEARTESRFAASEARMERRFDQAERAAAPQQRPRRVLARAGFLEPRRSCLRPPQRSQLAAAPGSDGCGMSAPGKRIT